MAEREIGGVGYRIERLDAMKQLHIARRLAPVLAKVAGLIPTAAAPAEGDAASADQVADPAGERGFLAALGGMAEAAAHMSDEDVDYVIKTCLGVCLRANPHGSGWSPVAAPNGRLMFQDIDLPVMMQLTWAAVEENLGGFFGAFQSISGAARTAASPTA